MRANAVNATGIVAILWFVYPEVNLVPRPHLLMLLMLLALLQFYGLSTLRLILSPDHTSLIWEVDWLLMFTF